MKKIKHEGGKVRSQITSLEWLVRESGWNDEDAQIWARMFQAEGTADSKAVETFVRLRAIQTSGAAAS